jgi:hypothetical protein
VQRLFDESVLMQQEHTSPCTQSQGACKDRLADRDDDDDDDSISLFPDESRRTDSTGDGRGAFATGLSAGVAG